MAMTINAGLVSSSNELDELRQKVESQLGGSTVAAKVLAAEQADPSARDEAAKALSGLVSKEVAVKSAAEQAETSLQAVSASATDAITAIGQSHPQAASAFSKAYGDAEAQALDGGLDALWDIVAFFDPQGESADDVMRDCADSPTLGITRLATDEDGVGGNVGGRREKAGAAADGLEALAKALDAATAALATGSEDATADDTAKSIADMLDEGGASAQATVLRTALSGAAGSFGSVIGGILSEMGNDGGSESDDGAADLLAKASADVAKALADVDGLLGACDDAISSLDSAESVAEGVFDKAQVI